MGELTQGVVGGSFLEMRKSGGEMNQRSQEFCLDAFIWTYASTETKLLDILSLWSRLKIEVGRYQHRDGVSVRTWIHLGKEFTFLI